MAIARLNGCQVTESRLDLSAQSVDQLFSISPKSVLGLFWLQSHFPVDEWDVLLNGQAIFSAECLAALVADARSAGLAVTAPERVTS